MLLQNKRFLIISSLGVLFFIVLPLVLFLINITSQDSTIYNDPLSGETIYSPKGRIPEKYNQSVDEPIILGLSEFLNRGMSEDNVLGLKNLFTLYTQQSHQGHEISIDIKTINHFKDRNSSNVYIFLVRFDRDKSTDSDAKAIVDTNSIISLVINRNSKIIFDSNNLESHD